MHTLHKRMLAMPGNLDVVTQSQRKHVLTAGAITVLSNLLKPKRFDKLIIRASQFTQVHPTPAPYSVALYRMLGLRPLSLFCSLQYRVGFWQM